MRKGADRVRVTVQLIDGETETHIWAERYDRLGVAIAFGGMVQHLASQHVFVGRHVPSGFTLDAAVSRSLGCAARGRAAGERLGLIAQEPRQRGPALMGAVWDRATPYATRLLRSQVTLLSVNYL